MPSVEMRRSTRVFVPKTKDGELVRVLRSGRRLSVDLSDGKHHHRASNKNDEWFPLIEESTNYKQQPPPPSPPHAPQLNGWHDVGVKPDPKLDPMDVDKDEPEPVREPAKRLSRVSSSSERRMFRNVYIRKRKRGLSDLNGSRGDRKFGLHFVRRQRRRNGESQESLVRKKREDGIKKLGDGNSVLSIVVDLSCNGCSFVSRLLGSVFRHLGNGSVGFAQLSAFLVSIPISNVFSSYGVHFLWDRPSIKSRGLCRVFGERQLIPLFTVDFSALPLCFLQLHTALSFRSVRLSCVCWMACDKEIEGTDDDDEPFQYINSQGEHLLRSSSVLDGNDVNDMKSVDCCPPGTGRYIGCQSEHLSSTSTGPSRDGLKDMKCVNSPLRTGKLGCRNAQYRIGVMTRSGSKRRRRSMRSRRARNPSLFVMQKASGPSMYDHVTLKKNVARLPLGGNQELRRSARKSSTSEINVVKSDSARLNVDVDSQHFCYANLLVVKTDKCYRVEGAEVMLDLSSTNEWVLAVKKGGSTICCLKAQKEMRPSTTNRFTHAVVWAAENGWKLEFPDRKDWIVFKELYKVCGERNVVPTSPVVKIIPVPGVTEVINSWDSTSAPFERPESYIKMASDELSRVLSIRTANYDMDSEDEEWLSKFNSGSDEANILSEETFELMIDAFEKASYRSPEDVNDEKAAASLCLDLARPGVSEPVYRYWTKKRKQKRIPLLRVFELNQPKRAQVITKSVLRKKRSLKRTAIQPIQRGRGKDSGVLQAIVAERNAAEEQNAVLRMQEAKASADRSVELAICKRQRAQFLMENADLAMYRATMALRIADAAAQVVDSQQAATHFLD